MTDSTQVPRGLAASLALLLGLSVVAAGSTPYWARAALQSGLLLLFFLWWRSGPGPLPAGTAGPGLARLRRAAALFAALVLLQLVPLPPAARAWLAPGRAGLESTPEAVLASIPDAEGEPLAALPPATPDRAWRPISLAPADTLDAFVALLAYAALFATVLGITSSCGTLLRFCRFLAGLGGIIGAAGLLQDLAGVDRLFGVIRLRLGGAPYGPFVNHNHFAGLMELTLPVACALLLRRLRPRRPLQFWAAAEVDGVRRSRAHEERGREVRRALEVSLLIAAILVMSAALLRSLSRGGLLSLACASVTMLVLVPSRGRIRRREAALLGLMGAAAFAFFVWLGPSDVLEHFRAAEEIQSEPSVRGRLLTWKGCLGILRGYPLLGSGLGTFPSAFRQHYPPGTTRLWMQAHNDYLQISTETGIAGAMALLLGLIALGSVLLPPLRRGHNLKERYLYYGLLASILSLLLHSIVDFNLQIPSIGALFVVVCALAVAHRVVLPEEPVPATAGRAGRRARRGPLAWAPGWLLVTGLLGALGWIEMRAAGVWLQRSAYRMAVEGEPERALQRYERAFQLTPVGSVALAGRGRALVDLSRARRPGTPERVEALESAVSSYREALQRQPIDPGTWGALAQAYRSLAVARRASRTLDLAELGAWMEREPEDLLAVAAARQAARLEPNDYVHAILLGDLLRWQGQAEAGEWYRRAGFLWPRLISDPFPLEPEPPGDVLAALVSGAHSALGDGNRVPDTKILEELGLFHASRGEYAAAVEANGGAIDRIRGEDRDTPILIILESRQAAWLLALERYDEAEELLDGVLARNPAHSPAYQALGRLLLARGRPDEAELPFRRARDLAPGLLGHQMDLARALDLAGDWTGAVREYRRAASFRDGQAAAYRALAGLYRRQGREEEAVAYERLLRALQAP